MEENDMDEETPVEEESEDENSEDDSSESGSTDDQGREMYKAVCSDCGKKCEVPFKPTEGKPVRCKECFMKNRPKRSFGGNGGRSFGNRGGGFGGNRNFNREPREMHKATCSDCGKGCEVPFKPTPGKPVLCKDCYRNSKGF